MSAEKTLPCGGAYKFEYDVDSDYSFKYVSKAVKTMPSGLEKVITRVKSKTNTNNRYTKAR